MLIKHIVSRSNIKSFNTLLIVLFVIIFIGCSTMNLFYAVKENNLDETRTLISNGASVDSLDWHNNTPLSWTAQMGHTKIAKFLIDNGADVNHKSDKHVSPLILASYFGHSNIVQMLLRRNAFVDIENNYGDTPLILAAGQGHTKIVKILIDNGADVNHKSDKGVTPLISSSYSGHTDIVQMLLENNAFVDIENNHGATPLIWVAEKGYVEIAKLLIDYGADVNHKAKNGVPPLIVASYNGYYKIVQMLLENNAFVDVENKHGATPLIWAAEKGHVKIVKLLIDYGADINHKDNNNNTAYNVAESSGNRNILALLSKISKSKIAHTHPKKKIEQNNTTKILSNGDQSNNNSENLVNSKGGNKSLNLKEIAAEELAIVSEIMKNGTGTRLVIPGVETNDGPRSSMTISMISGMFWKSVMELPYDQIPATGWGPNLFGNGSIHRFNGEVRFNNSKLPSFFGEGDEKHRLTFILLSDIGYVYVRGQGRVVFPNGRTVQLKRKEDVKNVARTTHNIARSCRSIAWVQKRLKELGYDPGPIDGVIGMTTKNAIEKFQSSAGIEVTGELYTETCEKLFQKSNQVIRLKRAVVHDEPVRSEQNFIPWSDLSDPYLVSERSLQNTMVMKILGTRYVIDAVQDGEFLTRAPGDYGGITITGIRGKQPKVNMLTGYIKDENIDAEFYSVLGVGSSLQLPEEWIRAFGLRLRAGNIVIREDGILLRDVEKQ